MKKTKTTSNKTHGLFYSLLKQLDGYNPQFKEAIKEGIVSLASKGKTESLSVLYTSYPRAYSEMIESLKINIAQQKKHQRNTDEQKAEDWRKKCIAAVCGWLDKRNVLFEKREDKLSYAIKCICRSANCSDFNKISIGRLKDIYNEFLRKQKVVENSLRCTDFSISEN